MEPEAHHGEQLREAAHLGVQSLGHAAAATDAIVTGALLDIHATGGGEYGHLPEKHLQHTHTAMQYLSLGSAVADKAVTSDGHVFKDLFSDPNTIPSMVLPMLQHH